MKDIQSLTDDRDIIIDSVGISDIYYPVIFFDGESSQNTVGKYKLGVQLQSSRKGTHMSRFVEILERNNDISYSAIEKMLKEMIEKLDTDVAVLSVELKYFYEVYSPVTNKKSILDIECMISAEIKTNIKATVKYIIPISTLCPCSKEISSYGAHNQKAECIVELPYEKDNTKQIVDILINVGSGRVYPLLKREDEKYVTESAFDNPKFVEDVVRDGKLALVHNDIKFNYIEVRSHESIHNHIAYAKIYGE